MAGVAFESWELTRNAPRSGVKSGYGRSSTAEVLRLQLEAVAETVDGVVVSVDYRKIEYKRSVHIVCGLPNTLWSSSKHGERLLGANRNNHEAAVSLGRTLSWLILFAKRRDLSADIRIEALRNTTPEELTWLLLDSTTGTVQVRSLSHSAFAAETEAFVRQTVDKVAEHANHRFMVLPGIEQGGMGRPGLGRTYRMYPRHLRVMAAIGLTLFPAAAIAALVAWLIGSPSLAVVPPLVLLSAASCWMVVATGASAIKASDDAVKAI